MSSSGIRRGAVKTVEWWKHLRNRKRAQNKLVRQDGKAKSKDQMKSSDEIPIKLVKSGIVARVEGDF